APRLLHTAPAHPGPDAPTRYAPVLLGVHEEARPPRARRAVRRQVLDRRQPEQPRESEPDLRHRLIGQVEERAVLELEADEREVLAARRRPADREIAAHGNGGPREVQHLEARGRAVFQRRGLVEPLPAQQRTHLELALLRLRRERRRGEHGQEDGPEKRSHAAPPQNPISKENTWLWPRASPRVV